MVHNGLERRWAYSRKLHIGMISGPKPFRGFKLRMMLWRWTSRSTTVYTLILWRYPSTTVYTLILYEDTHLRQSTHWNYGDAHLPVHTNHREWYTMEMAYSMSSICMVVVIKIFRALIGWIQEIWKKELGHVEGICPKVIGMGGGRVLRHITKCNKRKSWPFDARKSYTPPAVVLQ